MHEFSSLLSDSRFTEREAVLIAGFKDISRDIFIADFLDPVELEAIEQCSRKYSSANLKNGTVQVN